MEIKTGNIIFARLFHQEIMKMHKLKYALILCAVGIGTMTLNAQKFGYLNSAALLQEMPEVKEAEANLETLQKQLQAKGKKLVEDFQAKYADLERRQNEIAPKDLEGEVTKLREEEANIGKFEQDMQRQLVEKRETLLQPILDRVNQAIKELAEAEGYTYIFDSSAGVLLYADETTDVTSKVKAKLGMM
jgi:outer membrane protein